MKDTRESQWKQGSYQRPLEVVVAEAVEQWQCDRTDSLRASPQMDAISHECECGDGTRFSADEILNMSRRCVQSLSHLLHGLTTPDKESDIALAFALTTNSEALWNIIKEDVQVELMRDGVLDRNAANRLFRLADIRFCLRDLQLRPDTAAYMKLAIRAYVQGHNPACIVFCRSALEAALETCVSYDRCVQRPGRRKKGIYSLLDRLRVAKLEGLLDDDLTAVAQAINARANKVLHEDPRLTEKVDGIIFKTARVIRMLTTGTDPYSLIRPLLPEVVHKRN